MDLFTISLPQIFVIIGLLMILAELLVGIDTGFDLLLIGSILVISGLVGSFIAVSGIWLTVILAIILSILYIAFFRRRIKRRITVTTSRTNIDKIIGATGTVVREIRPDTAGMIRINDEQWRASADEILYDGETVVVNSVEGVTVIVQKLAKLKG
ncbi:MAG: NfeD family protein [Chloroflexota bacterium]|jgi:membrane protein implicated in regulation of membrane protease activity